MRGHLLECRACGLLQRTRSSHAATGADCVRCSSSVRGVARRQALPLAAAGLGLLFASLLHSVAYVSMSGGRSISATIWSGVDALTRDGFFAVAVVTAAVLVLLPVIELGGIVCMKLAVWRGHVPFWIRRWFAAVPALAAWSMADVYVVGAVVSLTRLEQWAHVELGVALGGLLGVGLCCSIVEGDDREATWRRVAQPPASLTSEACIGCSGCGLVVTLPPGTRCPRCDRRLERRKSKSVQRTWALVIAAALMCIPANVLPIITVSEFGQGGAKTIFGGVLELQREGFVGLAIVVFVASIVVPGLKLLTLVVLLIATQQRRSRKLIARTKLYHALEKIGRWSMLDVFATMVLASLATFGWVGSVIPGMGIAAFCAVVILTMLATEAFDPRLMWDAAAESETAARAAPGSVG